MPHLKDLKHDAKRLMERVETSSSKDFAFSNEGNLSVIDVDGVLFESTVNALELRDFVFCNNLAQAVESSNPYKQALYFPHKQRSVRPI